MIVGRDMLTNVLLEGKKMARIDHFAMILFMCDKVLIIRSMRNVNCRHLV